MFGRKINTTSSIREEVKKAVHAIEGIAHSTEHKVQEVIEKDVSRLVHSLTVNAIDTGKDITVRFDHAAGEVKRIVLNGTSMTLENLISHIRSLA